MKLALEDEMFPRTLPMYPTCFHYDPFQLRFD
jgi:hypothetical protein